MSCQFCFVILLEIKSEIICKYWCCCKTSECKFDSVVLSSCSCLMLNFNINSLEENFKITRLKLSRFSENLVIVLQLVVTLKVAAWCSSKCIHHERRVATSWRFFPVQTGRFLMVIFIWQLCYREWCVLPHSNRKNVSKSTSIWVFRRHCEGVLEAK
jgi:hypothetical protein